MGGKYLLDCATPEASRIIFQTAYEDSNDKNEITHLVWIGPKLTDSALRFLREYDINCKIKLNIYFWLDMEIMTDDLSLITNYQNELVKITIKNIRDLDFYKEVSEKLYPLILSEKAYSYGKEFFSLMVLSQYGGFFFDTTNVLSRKDVSSDSPVISLFSEHDCFIAPLGGTRVPDVFFYYCPESKKPLCKMFLIFMTNIFKILFLSFRYKNESIHKCFKRISPILVDCEIPGEVEGESMISLMEFLYRSSSHTMGWRQMSRQTVLINHLTTFFAYLYRTANEVYGDDVLYIWTYSNPDKHACITYNISPSIIVSKYFGGTKWYSDSTLMRKIDFGF